MALLALQEGLGLWNRPLVDGEFLQAFLASPKGVSSQQESLCGLGGGWEQTEVFPLSPLCPPHKVAGRWDPRALGLGASLHLPTSPCVLLEGGFGGPLSWSGSRCIVFMTT